MAAMTRAGRVLYRIQTPKTLTAFPSTEPLSSRYLLPLAPQHSLHFPRHLAMPPWTGLRAAEELRADLEVEMRRKTAEMAEKKDKGEVVEEEDYTGVGKSIEKLERHTKFLSKQADQYVEPSDSEGEEDDRYWPQELKKREDEFNRRCREHEVLLKKFAMADTIGDADTWMNKINQFEQKYLKLPLEYRVIGEMMNKLKDAKDKERFVLLQKLNRAVRLAESRQANNPNNPVNYGMFSHRRIPGEENQPDAEKEKPVNEDDRADEDFSERKEEDDVLLEKLNSIDRKLEEKLSVIDQTFGKKGRALQEEIKCLAQERYALTAEKRIPLCRKGFDVKLIDVNRTCKVTKGGRLFKFKVILACGNYNGVVGFAKGKGPKVNDAIQRAHEKCFENLHYVERYEEHTIPHAIKAKYGNTKIYLWPAGTATGVVAGRTVETLLLLAGYKNIKSKVVGARNTYNTVKALFCALNAIETPKDVQEKFGRTVVESYLL